MILTIFMIPRITDSFLLVLAIALHKNCPIRARNATYRTSESYFFARSVDRIYSRVYDRVARLRYVIRYTSKRTVFLHSRQPVSFLRV